MQQILISSSIFPLTQNGPKIAVSGNFVHIVWDGAGDIFYRRSTDGGATFAPIVELSISVQQQERPAISVDGNNVYVIWEEGGEIFFRKSVDGGTTFEPAASISEGAFPDIAAHGNNIYVVWSEGGQIFIKKSEDLGASFGPSQILSENVGFSNLVHIAVSANNIFVVWSNAFGNEEIWFTRSADGGNTFETAENLSNSPGDSRVGLSYAVAANGNNVYVVWYDEINPSEPKEILYRQSSDGGSTFGDIVNISSTPGQSLIPSVAADEGSVYIVWTEGPNFEIAYRASILPYGAGSSLIDLTNNLGNSGPATIAVSS